MMADYGTIVVRLEDKATAQIRDLVESMQRAESAAYAEQQRLPLAVLGLAAMASPRRFTRRAFLGLRLR